MDENYILLPHGVNFQEAIFPDTQENRRMFASLFQFSNCSQAQHMLSFSSDWEIQEDNRPSAGSRRLRAPAWERDDISGGCDIRNLFLSSSQFYLQSVFPTPLEQHRDLEILAQHNMGVESSVVFSNFCGVIWMRAVLRGL
ncbi:hypothetical protein DV515_00007577 [Chloebia gouldiae]|uniref:Coiled-coil domain-containing protein 3 n=1 Tax=Chloebia gouldiae TaxID=44316 RepID=A0A3L8SHX7_CHLGU|nr:hypothetical protein DV515_00007577 [Chloebia gouldiae]